MLNSRLVLSTTIHGKYLAGEKLANLVNCEVFTRISSPIFTDTLKLYLACALTVAYSPNFSSPITFTCTVSQNFPRQIFPMYGITVHMYR